MHAFRKMDGVCIVTGRTGTEILTEMEVYDASRNVLFADSYREPDGEHPKIS
jgi:hypothetical protein